MQGATVFRIVDAGGRVLHSRLTSAQADAFMAVMLPSGEYTGLRSERMDAAPPAAPTSVETPAIAAAFAAESALSQAISAIVPGTERAILRDAIEARGKASEVVAQAAESVARAKALLATRQLELDVLLNARTNEIAASGANLAESLKRGHAPLEADRHIGSAAIADAEIRRDTAQSALDQLTSEYDQAEGALKTAESALRLAVTATKRTEAAAMVTRLASLKSEFMSLAAMVEASRYADVPLTSDARDALRVPVSEAGAIDAAARRWHAITEALRQDENATFEDAR